VDQGSIPAGQQRTAPSSITNERLPHPLPFLGLKAVAFRRLASAASPGIPQPPEQEDAGLQPPLDLQLRPTRCGPGAAGALAGPQPSSAPRLAAPLTRSGSASSPPTMPSAPLLWRHRSATTGLARTSFRAASGRTKRS
jgi:hypothetical protein